MVYIVFYMGAAKRAFTKREYAQDYVKAHGNHRDFVIEPVKLAK